MFHISLIGSWCILDTLSESEEEWMKKQGIKSYGGDRDVYEVWIDVGKRYLGVYIGGLHENVSPNDSIALVAPK